MSVDLKDKEHSRIVKMVAKDYKRELRKIRKAERKARKNAR